MAGAAAGAAGAATFLGSSTLGSVVGGLLVTTTPVGWVVGCAVAGAATAYGVSKLIRSAGRNDRVREEIVARLSKRLGSLKSVTSSQFSLLKTLKVAVEQAVREGNLTSEQAIRIVTLVEANKLDSQVALTRVQALCSSREQQN